MFVQFRQWFITNSRSIFPRWVEHLVHELLHLSKMDSDKEQSGESDEELYTSVFSNTG